MLEALEKLREYVDKQREEYNNHNVSFVWQLGTIADEIEAEIAEARETTRKKHRAERVYWQNELHKILDTINGQERFWGDCMDYPLPEATIPPSEIAKRMLEERYMRLPRDVDGVPIHIGDRLEMNGVVIGNVTAVGFNGEQRVWVLPDGNYLSISYLVEGTKHVKPRTLEDVPEEYAHEYYKLVRDGLGSIAKLKMRKAADEIRELLGGDA